MYRTEDILHKAPYVSYVWLGCLWVNSCLGDGFRSIHDRHWSMPSTGDFQKLHVRLVREIKFHSSGIVNCLFEGICSQVAFLEIVYFNLNL